MEGIFIWIYEVEGVEVIGIDGVVCVWVLICCGGEGMVGLAIRGP